MGIGGYILIIFCCVLLSAFFAGAETGVLSCNRIRMHYLAKRGDRRGRMVEKLLTAPEKLIALILVGNNLSNVTATTVTTYVLIQLMEEHHAEWVSALVMSVVILVFGEVIPKALFRQRADALTPWAAPVLRIFHVLLAPLVFVMAQLSKVILRILGVAEKDRRFFVTRKELQLLAEESQRAGAMDPERSRMIRKTLDLRHMIVRDITIPLPRIPKVDQQRTVRQVLPVVAKTEQPGVLVFEGSPYRFRGVLFPLHLANVQGDTPVGDVMAPIAQVRDVDRVDWVLEKLQKDRHHLALVIDRGGNALGWVTLVDAVGEILGGIEKEPGAR